MVILVSLENKHCSCLLYVRLFDYRKVNAMELMSWSDELSLYQIYILQQLYQLLVNLSVILMELRSR